LAQVPLPLGKMPKPRGRVGTPQRPTPNAQRPRPNAQRPAPNALCAVLCALCLCGGCGAARPEPARPRTPSTVTDPSAAAVAPLLTRLPVRFTDVTSAAGIRWTFSNGATGRHLFIETTGGGAAFLDCDGDGRLDLFAVQ